MVRRLLEDGGPRAQTARGNAAARGVPIRMMANMEVNKVIAAVLTAGITLGVAGVIGRIVVRPEMPHHSAIQIGEASAQQQQQQAPAAPQVEPITPLLANANPQQGQQIAQRLCGSCHTFNEGGRAGVGPNLYGIIGNHHAHMEGFNYSNGMKAKSGEPWTYEALNAFINKPSAVIPGTRMSFGGLSNNQQRADVIAFLRSISPNAPAP